MMLDDKIASLMRLITFAGSGESGDSRLFPDADWLPWRPFVFLTKMQERAAGAHSANQESERAAVSERHPANARLACKPP
jgi:hypothetical protein